MHVVNFNPFIIILHIVFLLFETLEGAIYFFTYVQLVIKIRETDVLRLLPMTTADRYGNTVRYDGRKFTDTLGRIIYILPSGIVVNGTYTVYFETIQENNALVDPNDYLVEDNRYYFNVTYMDGEESAGTTQYDVRIGNIK